MKLDSRLLAGLCLSLALSFPTQAAPGRFTPVGPFGTMDAGVEELVYLGSDGRRMLILQAGDLFESRDAGHSWRSALANSPEFSAARLATDPSDADRWYVTGERGVDSQIWQTTDAGRTWSVLPTPAVGAGERELFLFVDRFQPASLALEIGVYRPESGYEFRRFLSGDRGQSWTELELDGLERTRTEIVGLNGGSLYLMSQRYDLASGAVAPWILGGIPYFDLFRPDSLFIAEIGYHEADLFVSHDRGATRVALVSIAHDFVFLAQSPAHPDHLALGRASGISLSLDRGATWTEILPNDSWRDAVPSAAFDPATGELIFGRYGLERRRSDGSRVPLAIQGLLASSSIALATGNDSAVTLDFGGRTAFRDPRGVFVPRGSLPGNTPDCISGWQAAILPADGASAVLACEQTGIFATRDGGATWTRSPEPPPAGAGTYRLLARGTEYFLLTGGEIYRSVDFGLGWERLIVSPNGSSGFAVHPDPDRGIAAVGGIGGISILLPGRNPEVNVTYLPGGGVAPGGGIPHSQIYRHMVFAHDPAHPDLIYAIHGEVLSRSLDFGRHWQEVANLESVLPAWDPLLPFTDLLIDPFDPDHLLLPEYRVESHDGGQSFVPTAAFYGRVAFDRQVPGRLLAGSSGRGVLEWSETLPACPGGEEIWCAGNGRYLLTVDWKDHRGQRGQATRVATGNANSGLFHFFDAGNWELLVKVLDGCAINQRQWVFAAGTTDVEYALRVEDRWTGQIRHYATEAGQAAPAITDSDAFAGCVAAPPVGARAAEPEAAGEAGEPTLELLGGRFEARTRWTDFDGRQGDGLAVGLHSESSGLFYFFEPNNWEMLVKVLDGCAINGHYWVLAAATTDVGFELQVSDREGGARRTYRNPAGRAAPATIDLEAFACAAP